MNARPRKQPMSELARKRIARLNAPDLFIYEYFLKRFAERISAYSEKLLRVEVKYMRKRRMRWFRKCVGGESETAGNLTDRQPVAVADQQPRARGVLCKMMTSKELELTDFIRTRQRKMYPGSVYGPPNKAHG